MWYTHCGSADPALPGGTACRVDLGSGAGLADCLAAAAPLGAVVNAAAVSQPALCERDPAAARAVNVPTQLVAALASAAPHALLVHVSTDQVYDGTRPWNREGDAAAMRAANAYGASKRDAEALVTERWANHAVLRSSIIVGPAPRAPVGRPLFLQWLDGALAGPAPTELFEDEYRSPVCVDDLVAACAELLRRAEQGPPLQHRVFNLGGPERCVPRGRLTTRAAGIDCQIACAHACSRSLSRADMGDAVAALRGHPRANVRRVPAASVSRPVPSPADISMDSSRAQTELGLTLTPFAEAVRRAFKL